MHKVFISYHHANDQYFKDELLRLNVVHSIFIDQSVDTGDIDDDLSDEAIRTKIRDEYLRDTTVTVLLVGTGTSGRKHIDWELYSSMFDGTVNKKSGIVVVNLPSVDNQMYYAAHENEKAAVYPDISNWKGLDTRLAYVENYGSVPDRIIDNLLYADAKISVASWDRVVANPASLSLLIENAYGSRAACNYDLSRGMRRRNA